MLDWQQRSELDNYITGHFGEDQFRENDYRESPFDEGGTARVTGVPILMNPYDRESADALEWERGWKSEDTWLRCEGD